MRLDSEEGLSFIEFNYMILQAYDFLELFNRHKCRLQMGGSDQWGNIVAGVELIRKMHRQTAFGITFPLIVTSSGEKMGKTAKGAVWLDPARTSPYDYYQYWVNTDDRDVARFLALFTFLPMDEIRKVESLEGADLNSAKSILAFETTLLVHGRQEALNAYQAALSMFGGREIPQHLLPSSTIPRSMAGDDDLSVPYSFVEAESLKAGIPAFKLFHQAGLAASGGAARRLIEQGGAYVNGQRIDAFPSRMDSLRRVVPVYETFSGWQQDVSAAKTLEELPEAARQYIQRIGEVVGIPVEIVSVGPGREQTIFAK
jgi:tyrosyl-tRNA synthetase